MKKFLIIGNANAITYKEVFPLIKDNKLWMGTTYFNGGAAFFKAPKELYDPDKMSNEKHSYFNDNGDFMWRVNGVRWFTNLDHKKRHEPLDLYKKYSPEEFPKYDNYDAIETGKVCDIPLDYDGVMGVPITFLGKYCPEQFEIIGMMSGVKDPVFANGNDGRAKFYVNDKGVYARILIKHHSEEPDIINGGVFNNPYVNGKKKYQRLLIKKR